MGAESSSLQNCQLEEALQVSSDKEWQLHPGKTGDGTPVSVFVYKKAVQNKNLIENAAKNLKILRHPCIVKFLGWTKSSDGHRLITEPVTPLELQLDSLTSLEVCAGLHDVIQALSFLHDRGGFCHNNISVSTIFVSEDGSWKLGCMEHVCRYEEVTLDKLKASAPSRDGNTISPEEKNGKLLGGSDIGHARDAYAFGMIVEQVSEYLGHLGSEAEWFAGRVQEELLNEDPKQRPKLSTFLKDPIFQNDFVEIISFLKNITVKSEMEKKTFFGNIVEKLHNLPAELVARRLTRLLLSRFVLLDQTADKELVPHFLHPCHEKRLFQIDTISPVLPKGLFQKFVIPELFKIFHVRDCHVRLVILRHFAAYVGLFDRSTLQSVILPQVIIGLRDSHDDLVSASLHALAEMVPILGAEVVIGSNRHSIFKEGKPKFKIMNGSAINHIDKYIEPTVPTPDKIAGVLPMANDMDQIDNATGSLVKTGKTLKDQAKEAERQKKREEARKRMEERRRRREERRNVLKGKEVEEESSDTVSQQSLSPRHQAMGTAIASEDPSRVGHSGDPALVSEGESRFKDNIDEKENSPEENSEKNSLQDSLDEEDIDKAIESEINAMDSTLSPKDMNRIKILDEGPVVTVDWSDIRSDKQEKMHSDVSKKGVLKLKTSGTNEQKNVSEKSATRNDTKNNTDTMEQKDSWGASEDTWGYDDWGSEENSPRKKPTDENTTSDFNYNSDFGDPVWNKNSWGEDIPNNQTSVTNEFSYSEGNTVAVVNKARTSEKKHFKKPQGSSSDLGSEFDIKSISIKKQSEPDRSSSLDFFADMEPVIKSSSLLDQSSSTKVEDSSKSTLSFDMVMDNTSEADGGWGDDLEWGEEDNWS